MSGRGLGQCAGYAQPGFMTGGWGGGMGRGRGFGMGRGFRGMPVAPAASPGCWPRRFPTESETRQDLEAYRDQLRRELEGVEQSLAGNKPAD
jgi:hypothetical protein